MTDIEITFHIKRDWYASKLLVCTAFFYGSILKLKNDSCLRDYLCYSTTEITE